MTALHYGDPAVYSADQKRLLLKLLPDYAPHHGWPAGISLGGLASVDLVPDFIAILLQDDFKHNLVLTVVEVLERGSSLIGLDATYEAIVLDPLKPLWLRERAFNLSFHLHGESVDIGYEYFESLASEESSSDRVRLQLHIAVNLIGKLTTGEIRLLLRDFASLQTTQYVGLLIPLERALRQNVPTGLFDTPVSTWLPNYQGDTRRNEVDNLLDAILGASIRYGDSQTAEQIWRWAQNLRQYAYGPYGKEIVSAIAERYGQDVQWRVSLLESSYRFSLSSWEMAHHDHNALMGDLDASVLMAAWQHLGSDPHNESLLAALVYSLRNFDLPSLYWQCLELLQSRGALELEDVLTSCQIRPEGRRGLVVSETTLADQAQWLQDWHAKCDGFREGFHIGTLHLGAGVYLNGQSEQPGEQYLASVTNSEIASAMVAGFRHLATTFAVDPVSLQQQLGKGDTTLPLLAGIVLMLDEDETTFKPDLSLALFTFFAGASDINNYSERSRIQQWALEQIVNVPKQASSYLVEFWTLHLAAGGKMLPGIPLEPSNGATAAVFGEALAEVMRSHVDMPSQALAAAWRTIAKCLPVAALQGLVASTLPSVPEGENMLIWRTAQMSMNPVVFAEGILVDYPEGNLIKYMDRTDYQGFGERLLPNDAHASCRYYALLICLASRKYPISHGRSGSTFMITSADFAMKYAIRQLAKNPVEEAGVALVAFSNEPSLQPWRSDLSAAVLTQAAAHRDEKFSHTTPAQLSALLRNGPPLNAADLSAVIATELDRFRDELRTGDLSPWAHFWNYDGATLKGPRIENLCRDHLLTILRTRLERYQITAAMAEAQHAGSTRADMLVISGANVRVPVEVKRHLHRDVWTAASTQLQHYAEHPDAQGMGFYVVLWFGLKHGALPRRPGKRAMPKTAEQFREFLMEDIPEPLRSKTEIVALDVTPVRRIR